MESENTVPDIIWQDSYGIGNSQLDNEHKELFTIASKANRIHNLTDKEEQIDILRTTLAELHSYVRFHFSSEEELMKNINYPNLKEHIILHKSLLDQINFIIVNLTTMTVKRAEEQTYSFVRKIFLKHIQTEDIKISNFIKNS